MKKQCDGSGPENAAWQCDPDGYNTVQQRDPDGYNTVQQRNPAGCDTVQQRDSAESNATITWRSAKLRAEKFLMEAGIAEPRSDAAILLKHFGNFSDTDYLLHSDEQMPEEAAKRFWEAVEKRKQHVPVQHITGRTWFMGYEFLVSPDVLIPRQDTEILVDEACKFLRSRQERSLHSEQGNCSLSGEDSSFCRQEGSASLREGTSVPPSEESCAGRVLDLCTGSGCIAISLSREFEDLEVTAGDISGKALSIARENALRNSAKVNWYEGDLFDGACGRFDLIVSNPPYIEREEIKKLDEEVRLHDPVLALDGGADGLLFYRRICREAPRYLKKGGGLFFEIGCSQAGQVETLLKEQGFDKIRTVRDLAGLDRVVSGIWSGEHV